MNAITLPSELAAWAEAEVAAGRAPSVEALVEDALSERRERLQDIRSKLNEARRSLAAGAGIDGDTFLAEIDGWIAEDDAQV